MNAMRCVLPARAGAPGRVVMPRRSAFVDRFPRCWSRIHASLSSMASDRSEVACMKPTVSQDEPHNFGQSESRRDMLSTGYPQHMHVYICMYMHVQLAERLTMTGIKPPEVPLESSMFRRPAQRKTHLG